MGKPIIDETKVTFHNLNQLSEIPPSGIVSKGLLETHGVKMVLFAMDEGQEISEHRSPFPATIQVWSGKLIFTVEGKEYELNQDDFLYMTPGAAHELKAVKPTRFLLTLVKSKESSNNKK